MTCDDVRALTSRGPLRALIHDERRAVLAHLDDCGLHPGLAEALEAAPEDASPETGVTPPLARPGFRRAPSDALFRLMRVLPWLLVAMFGIAALWGWLRPAASGTAFDRASVVPTAKPVLTEASALVGPSRGTLTYDSASGLMLFAASGLPPAPPDAEYQLWLVRGTTPLSLGTFATTADGRASVGAELRLQPGEVIAVTVEVTGGSPAPTSAPFLAIAYRRD